MAHKISKELAMQYKEKEHSLQEMQKQGDKLPKSRRQKKYEVMRKKQDGRLWKIKDRIKKTGGKLPEHLKEEKT